MIYIVVNDKEVENKKEVISDFVESLIYVVSHKKNLLAITKSSLDYQMINLYKDSFEELKLVSKNSSTSILNGINIAYDETLDLIRKINKMFKDELKIDLSKNIENEDLESLNMISNIPTHYLNSELKNKSEVLEDFKTQESEDRCIIVNLFSDEKNTENDNIHELNLSSSILSDESSTQSYIEQMFNKNIPDNKVTSKNENT